MFPKVFLFSVSYSESLGSAQWQTIEQLSIKNSVKFDKLYERSSTVRIRVTEFLTLSEVFLCLEDDFFSRDDSGNNKEDFGNFFLFSRKYSSGKKLLIQILRYSSTKKKTVLMYFISPQLTNNYLNLVCIHLIFTNKIIP